MFLKAHETLSPINYMQLQAHAHHGDGHVHVVVTHIIILDYPIITQMCQSPEFHVVNPR